MKGSEFVAAASKVTNFQDLIVDAVTQGYYVPIECVPVETEFNGHKGTIFVSSDALRIGMAGDSVRANVSGRTAQLVADHLDFLLPSTRICDLVYLHARARTELIDPQIQPPDTATRLKRGYSPSMNDAEAMRRASLDVDRKKLVGKAQLICNAGKDWVVSTYLSKKPLTRAANYGWFSDSAPYRSASGYKMWQTLGFAHNLDHYDYSQVLRLVRPQMMVDGKMVDLRAVAADAELAGLVSSEGVITSWRHPGIAGSEASNSVVPAFPEMEPPTMPTLSDPPTRESLVTAFVQARNYTAVNRSQFIKHIVLHTAETAENFTVAEALARWASGPSAPQASWHFAVDADSIVQCVDEEQIAWHAPGCNKTGIGIEMAGVAKQNAQEWDDDFSRAVLDKTARLVAYLVVRWKVSTVFVDAEGLLRGDPGITTHMQVSKACRLAQERGLKSSPFYNQKANKPLTDHYDPGSAFPLEGFLGSVRRYLESQ